MFNQFRNAVEQLAQQPIRILDASSAEHASEPTGSRSQSLDIQANRSTSPLSSSQLAESAISSLRKSFASQRSHSGNSASSPSPKPAQSPEPPKVHKSNLEERLRRATYAIGDASGSSTPQRSSRVASPSPMGRNRKAKVEQSPASTPLPGSPAVTSTTERDKKLEQPSELSLHQKDISAPQHAGDDGEDKAEPTPVVEPPIPAETTQNTEVHATEEATSDPLGVEAKQGRGRQSQRKSEEKTPTSTNSAVESSVTEQPSPVSFPQVDDDQIVLESPPKADTNVEETSAEPLVASTHKKSLESVIESTPVAEESTPTKPEANSATDSVGTDSVSETPVATFIEATIEKPSEPATVPQTSDDGTVGPEPAEATVENPVESSPATTPYHSLDNIANSSSSSSEGGSPSSEEGETQNEPSTEPEVEQVALEIAKYATQTEPTPISTPPLIVDRSVEVESLQARLALIEQRFSDVSASFKRLQAEKLAADTIFRESSPLESISDTNALREYFDNLKVKDQVFQEELKRLNQKLELQDDRFEEVRELHRMESHSLTDEIKKLKSQLEETEALFQAAQRATSHAEEAVEKQKENFAQLQKEVDNSKNVAKEEEEKRVKAISLLKTVRQKLVKAEKDKEDALKELVAFKEREKSDKNKEQIDRLNFQQELEELTASHENAMANLRAQFAKDLASTKERYEQEIAAIRVQSELELASSKASSAKELAAKNSQIATLESSLNNVTRDKNAFFDQLQLRQAEVESAQAHLESLEHQNTEFQFQLRESTDRLSLLKEEYSELLREQESRPRDSVPSADEISRLVSATEAKYEAKLAEMKRNIAILEKERAEGEADWSKKLKEKMKDLEDVKRALASVTMNREADENVVSQLKADLAQAQETAHKLQRQVTELPLLREQIHELQKNSKEREEEISVKVLILEKQIEESKTRETQLKQANKTLREELRKVQSSAALLERQRNPGVGYWTTRVAESNGPSDARRPSVSTPPPEPSPRVSSPTPSTATSNKNEEEVNLEYLRNVILQFLEHKEMRPNLVKVLSIILHFTPQETRRLIAKV